MTNRPVLLKNPVQPYEWGSTSEIQNLLGMPAESGTPWAELWMGAHPKAPSMVFVDDIWIRLDEWIRAHPEAVLGEKTARTYDNTLPYLFKVLAAERPLSIQAHPDRDQAREGFERENRQGIPLDAPHRNYRDPWPKPELICALKPFCALVGFRSPEAIARQLEHFCPRTLEREIADLSGRPVGEGIEQFFRSVMGSNGRRRKQLIAEALENAAASAEPEAFWCRRLHTYYPDDIGVLAPAFLNLVEISPGRALFLPAGVLHAYLYGLGVEIMANSDNVLRGGLTSKHVDAAELIRILRFFPYPVELLAPEPVNTWESRYSTPAAEFALSQIRLTGNETYRLPAEHSAEILLCLEGRALVQLPDHGEPLVVEQGGSALVPAAAGTYQISGRAHIYRAGVPL